MTKHIPTVRSVRLVGNLLRKIFLSVLLAGVLWGQSAGTASATSQDQIPQNQPSQAQPPPGEGARSTQSETQDRSATTEEKTVPPQSAKELFRSVDELLKFASDDTGMPVKHEVKRKLA